MLFLTLNISVARQILRYLFSRDLGMKMIYDCIPANISCFPRRLEDVFSVTVFDLTRCLEDVLKTSSRGACKMSSENVFKMSSQDVFKMSSGRLQGILARRLLQGVLKTYSRRIQEDVLQLCLEDVLKTSQKTKKCYTEDAFSTSSPRRMFTGMLSLPLFLANNYVSSKVSTIKHPDLKTLSKFGY